MLRSPQQLAALMTPNRIKPPQWFHSFKDFSPDMTAAPGLWRGAQMVYSPMGSDFQDLARNTKESSRSGTIARRVTERGLGAGFDNSAIITDRNHLGGKDEGTVLCYIITDEISANHAIATSDTDSGDGGWAIWADNSGSEGGGSNLISFDTSTFSPTDEKVRVETSTNSISVGVPAVVVARSGIGLSPQVWIDGVDDTDAVDASGNGAFDGLRDTQIGNHQNAAIGDFNGAILLIVLWDRYLSDTEMLFVGTDPFAMLRPGGF